MYPIHCIFGCQGSQEIQRAFPGWIMASWLPRNMSLYIIRTFLGQNDGVYLKKVLKNLSKLRNARWMLSFTEFTLLPSLRAISALFIPKK